MKKLFLCMIIGLALCGCNEHPPEDNLQKPPKHDDLPARIDPKIYRLNYENHDYIYFYRWIDSGGGIAVIHDPDCKCHKAE